MKQTNRNIITKIIALTMLSMVSLLILNNSVFIHTHVTPDGSVFIHAHPFKKAADTAPFKSHQHTKAEFTFLNSLQLLFVAVLTTFLFSLIVKRSHSTLFLHTGYSFAYSSSHLGRAPPIH